MKRATNRTLLCAASALLVGMATSAQAQIEEIEVTATKTGATQLQKTPIAISAFSANDLDRSLTGNVKDLLQMTPNMTVPQNNSYAQIYIRGIGSNNVFSGSDPSSTVHIDGVYIGRPFGQFANFLDVERVEVLRGPQGTLYGRNSVGGTINVISRLPTDEIQGKAQLTLGNYSAVTGEAYLSGPIVPGKVQASVSGSYTEHDDYRTNVSTGGNLQNDKAGSGRFQLRLQPTDKIDAITRFDFFSQYNRPMGFAKILLPFDPLTNSILGDYSKVAQNGISRGTTRMYGVSEEIN
ncbi:MAG: TonB-dependent receptor, partial [Rhodospirillales bacterium]|nr:TonB-dependent receptor [Rhodospirillales bacterium]